MYHIKPDKRSQTSAQMIVNSFEQLIKQKPYTDITISDIQRHSSVSRSTFYRLFDNMDDIVIYLCDQRIQLPAGTLPIRYATDMFDCAQLLFQKWLNQEDLLALIVNIHREDIIYRSCAQYLSLYENILLRDLQNTPIKRQNITSTIYVMVGMLVTWIHSGKKDSTEEMMADFRQVLDDFYLILKRKKEQSE
jgi:AcrR family transcriptional regulator